MVGLLTPVHRGSSFQRFEDGPWFSYGNGRQGVEGEKRLAAASLPH